MLPQPIEFGVLYRLLDSALLNSVRNSSLEVCSRNPRLRLCCGERPSNVQTGDVDFNNGPARVRHLCRLLERIDIYVQTSRSLPKKHRCEVGYLYLLRLVHSSRPSSGSCKSSSCNREPRYSRLSNMILS